MGIFVFFRAIARLLPNQSRQPRKHCSGAPWLRLPIPTQLLSTLATEGRNVQGKKCEKSQQKLNVAEVLLETELLTNWTFRQKMKKKSRLSTGRQTPQAQESWDKYITQGLWHGNLTLCGLLIATCHLITGVSSIPSLGFWAESCP